MPPLHLDRQACHRAVSGRDRRYDGRLWFGVATTGIYCRPSCPARTPRPEHCQYFPTAAAAVAAGFRACKRCRPDALPGSPDWDARGDLSARAIRYVRDGLVDREGVSGLAAALAVSPRQLQRVLLAEVGATAGQLARTRRAHTARSLIEQTGLPLSDIAFAAGFGSLRQFNEVMRAEFGAPPSLLRPASGGHAADDSRDSAASPELTLRLPARAPVAAAPLGNFLRAHAVPGLDAVDAEGTWTRVLTLPAGEAQLRVTLPQATAEPATSTATEAADGGQDASARTASSRTAPAPGEIVPVTLRVQLPELAALLPVVSAVRRMLDLDADPVQVDEALGADPVLGPLVAARPGLRVPGAINPAETALFVVLGQRVSLAAARVAQSRLVSFLAEAGHRGVDAAAVAAADPTVLRERLGVPVARLHALQQLAAALAAGLDVGAGADRERARAALLSIPGIGPWTVEYTALRTMRDPDAFPAGDLVLQRALAASTARQATERAEHWRPWRAAATMHLWTKAVYS